MALIVFRKGNFPVTKNLCNALKILVNTSRSGGHWNYRYQPGPHPKTNEEHAAAAKKYGLTPLEYQPHPENMCIGDYPKLPEIGADSKDPYYPYDCPELKRNFNEPMHYRFEMAGEDRVNLTMKPRFSLPVQWMSFFFVIGSFAAAYIFLEDYHIGRPVTEKQYPGQGRHYLFCS